METAVSKSPKWYSVVSNSHLTNMPARGRDKLLTIKKFLETDEPGSDTEAIRATIRLLQLISTSICSNKCPWTTGSPDVQFACSRMVVRQWSPAFEALIRHGNELSNGFPKEVRLREVEAPSFHIVYDFMCTKELSVDRRIFSNAFF